VKKTDVEKMIFFRKKSDIPQKQERIARSGVSIFLFFHCIL